MEKTFAKGIELLETLVALGEPASVTRLANIQGLYKSNIHRLLRTLMACGYVAQTEDGLYMPTLRLTELGTTLWQSLSPAPLAQTCLQQIARSMNAPAFLLSLQKTGLQVEALALPAGVLHQPARCGDLLEMPTALKRLQVLQKQTEDAKCCESIAFAQTAGHILLAPLRGLILPGSFAIGIWSAQAQDSATLAPQAMVAADLMAATLGGNIPQPEG